MLAAAHYYVDTLGWALVELPPGRKGPERTGWNAPGGPVTTRADVLATWGGRPDWGIGLVHGPSRTCALDVDDLEGAREALAAYRLNLDQLLAASAGIDSGRPGRAKVLFALPSDLESLPSRRLLRNGRVVLELRAGAVQDCLPPTIHPETRRPYRWRGHPADVAELPEALAAAWLQLQTQPAPAGGNDGTGPIHERHLVLTSIAGAMRRRGASVQAIEAALLVENGRCVPPLSEREVRRIVASAARWKPAPLATEGSTPPDAPPPTGWGRPSRATWS